MKDYFGKFGDIVSVKIIDPQLYCYSASQYEDKRIMSIVSTIPRYANGDHWVCCMCWPTDNHSNPQSPTLSNTVRVVNASISSGGYSKGYAKGFVFNIENKLFVGMIPEGTTEDELRRLFEQYGEVKEVVIIKSGDAVTKGYGFCRYTTRKGALSAIQGMNGKTFLHVIAIIPTKCRKHPSRWLSSLQIPLTRSKCVFRNRKPGKQPTYSTSRRRIFL